MSVNIGITLPIELVRNIRREGDRVITLPVANQITHAVRDTIIALSRDNGPSTQAAAAVPAPSPPRPESVSRSSDEPKEMINIAVMAIWGLSVLFCIDKNTTMGMLAELFYKVQDILPNQQRLITCGRTIFNGVREDVEDAGNARTLELVCLRHSRDLSHKLNLSSGISARVA